MRTIKTKYFLTIKNKTNMKQIIVALVLFSLTACGKKDAVTPTPTPNPDTTAVKKAGLITSQFIDGKKVYEYTYNDSGKIVRISQYNEEVGALDTLTSITDLEYNTKGQVTKISSRNPDSTFANYIEDFTYDANGNPTTHKSQYYDSWEGKYKLENNWIRKNATYDTKGRITLLEAEMQDKYDTTQEKQEYKYDVDGNLIEYTVSYFDEIENKFIINENRKIQDYYDVLIPNALIISAPYPLNQIKKIYKKTIIDDEYAVTTTTLTIIEKDAKNNATKIKTDEISTRKSDGSVTNSSSIITLTYK